MGMMNLTQLSDCIAQHWSPTIGDPTVMGWVTVAAYAVTGYLCMTAGRRAPPGDARFWMVLSVVLFCLAANKQLDLQSALTAAGRCLARMQGWYEHRRVVQVAFILGLLATSLTIMLVALLSLRHALGRIGLALLGFGLVLTFVSVRAVGFHHVDRLIGASIAGARLNWILELSGLCLILVNALSARANRAPHIISRTSVSRPVTAAAAAMAGLIRCVRPPRP